MAYNDIRLAVSRRLEVRYRALLVRALADLDPAVDKGPSNATIGVVRVVKLQAHLTEQSTGP